MLRFLVTALAVLLVASITPGVRELVIDLAHFGSDGHAAHDDDCHDATGDEHGCTGLFHTCGCHASIASTTAPDAMQLEVHVPIERRIEFARLQTPAGPLGHARELLRPPTA